MQQQFDCAGASRLTLETYYERVHRPVFLAGAARATLAEYRSTLGHWRRLSADPPLAEITPVCLAQFRSALLDPSARLDHAQAAGQRLFAFESVEHSWPSPRRAIRSAATANKHLTHVQAILDKAGPPAPGQRDAMGILPSVPWIKKLKVPRRLPRDIDEERLVAVYRACGQTVHPKLPGVDREHWWQAMIVAALLTGYRREALLALRWEDIDLGRRLIRVEAESDKCDQERVKPLAGLVVKHLVRIRTARPEVFPWPAPPSPGHSLRTWARQWTRINRAAGLSGARRLKFHDLKRACGTRAAAAGASPHAIQMLLDHASLSTSAWYVNAGGELRDLVDRIALPAEIAGDL